MDTNNQIPFTQYLRPNGRTREVSIERPAEIYKKAMEIINAGYRFEVEELTTGQISMTISKDDEDCDIELVSNGPEVPVAVDRMITRFHAEKLQTN